MTSLWGFKKLFAIEKTEWVRNKNGHDLIEKAFDLRQSNMIKCSDINYTKQNCLVPFHKTLRIKSERVFTIQLLKNKCLPYFY